ncbi:MAG: hypothetical protein IKR89_01685 [Bacteroidaceae bacterium]|nr:hypothetical protein [Bacteroidaceae bacterium]
MTHLQERLFELQDKDHAAFLAKLTPVVPKDIFDRRQVPALRAFAKQWDATPPYIEQKVLAPLTHNRLVKVSEQRISTSRF